MLFDLLQPAVNINERVSVGQIENHQNAISPFVISFGNGAVPLLPGSVPNLKPYCAFVDLQSSKPEIDSDGCHVVLLEIIILLL